MTNGDVPRFSGWFDEDAPGGLDVELLVIERAVGAIDGPWKVAGALVRRPGKAPTWVEDWVDDYWSAEPAQLWEYFVEKGGGNAYSYEVAFLRIEAPNDAPAVIHHVDEILAQGHPLGLAPATDEAAVPDPSYPDMVTEDERSDPCEGHIHVEVPFPVADVATWQLAVELVRRHPADLWAIRTLPMDGHYDCLSVRRIGDVLASPSVAINRHGTHVKVDRLRGDADADQPLMSWGDAFATPDPRDWIRELEEAAGLRPPEAGIPPSTGSSLALRWIGMFLRMQLGSRERWTAWNDWGQINYDEPATDFEAVPAARDWLRAQEDPTAAAHVWFVGTSDETGQRIHFAVNWEGTLWTSMDSIDLLKAYRRNGSSVSRLVVDTAGPFLR